MVSVTGMITSNKEKNQNASRTIESAAAGDFNGVFKNALNKAKTDKSLNNPKIQEKFNQDIKRIASLMGIGPQTLLAVIGKLEINPSYYDFKVETNCDQAVKSVADYFGISPMTMLAVFDKLGIDKNDLTDKEKTGRIISKLKEFFGLSIDQEKELADILAEYTTKSITKKTE